MNGCISKVWRERRFFAILFVRSDNGGGGEGVEGIGVRVRVLVVE